MELTIELIESLKKLAAEETLDDLIDKGEDVCVDDFAGGNVDDAYSTGYNDGQVALARDILKVISQQ